MLASNLGCGSSNESSGAHGSKLSKLCNVLVSLPKKERILVFVQFPDLMDKVRQAIESTGIKTASLTGGAVSKSKVLSAFQDASNSSAVRVLLLNLGDESASGANLTTANHLVFVHPLVAESQQKWTQQEAQAVGRVRRYGQTLEVKVHRFIVDNSIDSEIMEERERDYIGLVVHVDPNLSELTDTIEEAVSGAQEADPQLRECQYPLVPLVSGQVFNQ